MKKYYIIDGYENQFSSLFDAKQHTSFWTESEKAKEIGTQIIGYRSGKPVSVTEITGIKDGRCTFSKTNKFFEP